MPTRGKKILIVEDEKAMARALELKLQHEGFEAKAIYNGESVVQELTHDTYHLILLDLVMPNFDGFQVLEALNAKKIKIPVLVLSNLSQEDDKKKVLALGARDFFIKSNTPIAHIVEYVKKLTV